MNIKNLARKTIINIRSSLTKNYQALISDNVCKYIRSMPEYRYAKKIALYYPKNGEIDLMDLFKSAPLHGKQCYFPVVNPEGDLVFVPAHLKTKFVKNKYGIPEPIENLKKKIDTNELDIIFMPLVAFDNFGNRLGMGAGYYDKSLKSCKNPLLIGVAYEFQKQPLIPSDPWDIKLQMIITDKGIKRNLL